LNSKDNFILTISGALETSFFIRRRATPSNNKSLVQKCI